MNREDKLILLGVISSAHGVKGDVIIKSFTDPKDNIFKLPIIDKTYKRLQIKFLRSNAKDELICKIENSSNRNQAELLKGTSLYCFRKDLPAPQKEEFYIEDLINLPVLDQNKQEIGVVKNIVNYGASDILEIQFNDNGKIELFPFTKELFLDITKNYIVLALSK